MIFERNDSIRKFGERLGYVFAYFLSTTLLFFALVLSHKLPASWSYLHIMIIVIIIASLGALITKILK